MNMKTVNSKVGTSMSIALLITAVGCSSADSKPAATDGKSGTTTTAAPAKLRVGLTDAGNQYVLQSPNINEDKYIKKIEQFTNTDLTLDMIPWKEYTQKMTLVFAGGDLPDLIQTNGTTAPEVKPAFDADVFMPLNDLIDQYAPNLKKAIEKGSWDSQKVSKDGKIYGIPNERVVLNNTVTYIRKDWLDKLGLKVPKTVNEYVDVLKAFRDRDPNGNGKKDEIPFSARANFVYGQAFFGAYDMNMGGWKYINGELVPNFIRPEMKEPLSLYRTLFEEKLMDNEFFVQTGQDWDAKIKAKSLVGLWQHSPSAPDKWQEEVKQGDPKAEILVIPSPVGSDGKGGVVVGEDRANFGIWMIPKSSKNAVAAIKLLDWFFTDEGKKLYTYGIEGQNYTVENGKINYKYGAAQNEIYEENGRNTWVRFVGPEPLGDKAYMEGKPSGKLIFDTINIANSEGRKSDAEGVPVIPALSTRPELKDSGLFMEFAAKVITGKANISEFNNFVEDWKKRGGDKVIQEATDWYKKNKLK